MTVEEGDPATFPVTLTKAVGAPVVIGYEVPTGAGKVDENDYSAPSSELTIPAGQKSGTITIRTIDDDLLEPQEELEVRLSSVTTSVTPSTGESITLGSPSMAMINIAKSDGPVFVSLPEAIFVDEGDEVLVTVTLTAPLPAPLQVAYSTEDDDPKDTEPADGVRSADGAATCNSDVCDYEIVTDVQLEIAAGETAATFTVVTRGDELAEASETFRVTLDEVSGSPLPDGVNFGVKESIATITDDALTATVTGPASVEEGLSAEYTVTVTGGIGDEEVTVTWSTEDSSATADDFSPTSGTLVLGGEEMSATFTIQTEADDIVELGEEIVVSLTAETVVDSESEPVRTGAPARTMIVDDDGAVEVSVRTNPDRPVVAEGDTAEFLVELSGTVTDPVTVQYTIVAASATAEDYIAPAVQTVEIPAGEMSGTISVTTRDDGQDEPDESFSVNLLSDGLPEGVEIEAGTARVRITDHKIRASVTASDDTVTEGDPVTFTVALTVDGSAAGARKRSGVEVHYEIVGTVTASDYSEASAGTLTIAAGQDEATITITTEADGVLDPAEMLTVRLTGATSLQNQGLAVVHPTEGEDSTEVVDESSVRWSVEDVTVDEGDPAIFTVTLNGPAQDEVTLTYRTVDDSAEAEHDYTGVPDGRVTVSGNSRSATFTVATRQDSAPESTETFKVELTLSPDAPAGVAPPSDEATASITDDDLALVPVPDVTMTEGETETITLAFNPAPSEAVMLRVTASGTAIPGVDFVIALPDGSPLPADGQFPLQAGTPAVPVTLRALDDSLAEATETLTAVLWTVQPDGQQGSRIGTVMVSIEDNDTLSAGVTAPETVAEGEVAPFTVRLRGGTSTADP